MLQVRDLTGIWADWLLYAVQYDRYRRHIDLLFAFADLGHSAGRAEVVARQTAINAIERGITFCTIYGNEPNRYARGA